MYQNIIGKSNFSSMISLLKEIIHWFWGTTDNLFLVLIIFTLIDLLTSILCLISKGKLSMQTISKLLYKNIALFLLVGVSHMIDAYLVGIDNAFRKITLELYIIYEGIVIFENASCLGVPIPKALKMFLINLYSGEDDT